MSWNPQEEMIELFTPDDILVEGVVTGIDGLGRQVFAIPVKDRPSIIGWVDVDVVHHRIIIETTSSQFIVQLVNNDDGGSVTRGNGNVVGFFLALARTCECVSSGTIIAGSCTARGSCRLQKDCQDNQNSGNCEWRD